MRSAVRILGCCAVLVAAPRSAHAEWHFTPFVGFTFGGNTTFVDLELGAEEVHFNWGGATTLIGAGPIGLEALFAHAPAFFQGNAPTEVPVLRSRALALMGNVVLATPRRWNEYGLRPFVSGGLGLMHASKTDERALFPGDNLLGYNIGGGAVGFLSRRTGLRFELRRYASFEVEEPETVGISIGPLNLSYWTATIGVVFRY